MCMSDLSCFYFQFFTVCIQILYLESSKTWNHYCKYGQKAIYWEVKYPFPLSNRDYVYVRERKDLEVNGRKIWVVLAKSLAVSQCPEKAGVIRVKDYKQSLALESDGANGTKVFMNYFDNPGGKIPPWLVNWAAKVSTY
uniref:Phosphatidylcholine transfer protein n=1 Tax=Astyanax mexicanus TaxID=7994 RepID=A0A8B9JKD8_ASTMX